MGYAVELVFDPESSAQIQTLSDAIYANCGGLDLGGIHAHPHVSLAVFDTVRPMGLDPILATLADQTAPFPLRFSAVGTFPGPQGVVYLAPVVTSALLALHTQFHQQLDAAGLPSHGYYRPGAWMPHCTVGFEVPTVQLPAAVALARQAELFHEVTIVGVKFIEYRPVRVLCAYQF